MRASQDIYPQSVDVERDVEQLRNSWRHPRGVLGWLSFTTHQAIGTRYIVTAFIMLLAGGIEALMIRTQLMRANNGYLGPERYNQIFTTHGTTMMFLFAVPVMEGMAIYLVPLMCGTRNVAFPRLNAFGYWMYLFGVLFLYWGVFTNTAPDVGWFAYPPLSGPQYTPGKSTDFWAQMITFTEVSALCVAAEIIATISKMRAPGMSLNRMPLYIWSILIQSWMIIFAMPAIVLASSYLLSDRTVGTHFVNPAEGGDPLLYQHIFWFFGHPEVYIIFIPALGFVSAIVVAHARREIVGYTAMVLAQIANGFIAFGLWVHHMFATDLPQIGEAYFTASSMMIAVTSGVQIFCWIATLWSGRPRMTTALHFVYGFIAIFVLGGLTGVMLAAVPLDLQAHDTYFVVAHFHYVLIGGALFPLFGAFYHWHPKFTGRLMNETLGRANFWVLFAGFNLTFFPMHILGLKGMPRRIYTYPPGMGWDGLNLLATVGAWIIAAGGILFIVNFLWSRKNGEVAGNNPWDADSLEWAASSPPANYNFEYLPAVTSRYPLWAPREQRGVVTGLATDRREALVTTLMDAEPHHRYILPGSSIWPLISAICVTIGFAGSVFNGWYITWGAIISGLAFIGWFWPKRPLEPAHD
ncbi:MAG: cytochrome c oxidase subunit I [Acidobacteriaceae bacterium]|nr:cytochrome c oxidase subunit I [Acidobacteriaceae bacterium]